MINNPLVELRHGGVFFSHNKRQERRNRFIIYLSYPLLIKEGKRGGGILLSKEGNK